MLKAVELGNLDVCTLLLNHRADVNKEHKVFFLVNCEERCESKREYPKKEYWLVQLFFFFCMHVLYVKKNKNNIMQQSLQHTALIYAVKGGFLEICKLLWNNGADVDRQTTVKYFKKKHTHTHAHFFQVIS